VCLFTLKLYIYINPNPYIYIDIYDINVIIQMYAHSVSIQYKNIDLNQKYFAPKRVQISGELWHCNINLTHPHVPEGV